MPTVEMKNSSGLRTYGGAVAIVTGGASGIGRALAVALAQRGARVVLADLQTEVARRVATQIEETGGNATAAELDVTDFSSVKRVVEDTYSRFGRLDYLFNNAGIVVSGQARLCAPEDWDRVFKVNLHGVAYGIQAAYSVMVERGYGHIVNTASMAAFMPGPIASSYCATKHAVLGLSNSLRIEAEPHGVRVSVVCPGVVRTPMLENAGRFGKMLQPLTADAQREVWEIFRPMDPGRFADKVLNLVARNRAIIIVPWWWKTLWWANRLSPTLGLRLASYLYISFNRRYLKQG